jgi:dolichol-phosphate mannosyltransferase
MAARMLEKNLIVVPTYNEAQNLEKLVREIRRVDGSDILVVDDRSPDGTGAIADELARALPGVSVIHRAGKLGLGSAHIRGMERAAERGYATVLTMDADFTHPPEYIPKLRQALVEMEADLVVGSRYLRKDGIADWAMWRRAVTRTADFLTSALLDLRFDATNALRIYRVATLDLDAIRAIRADGYSFMFEVLFVCRAGGMRIEQIPVHLPLRQGGKSKISRGEVLKAIRSLLRLSLVRHGRLGNRAGKVVAPR